MSIMLLIWRRAAASARLCVETQAREVMSWLEPEAAASARLCVETTHPNAAVKRTTAAASARLCVETAVSITFNVGCGQPPPRGCVLKLYFYSYFPLQNTAAASARLCVETLESGSHRYC